MRRHPESDIIWNTIRDPECSSCQLHEDAKTVCLLGDGPVPCDGMIVGEAPGNREDNLEIPFSGRSGMLLRRTLSEIGLNPTKIYITNVVACHPPGNRTPTTSEAKTCSSLYLNKQVEMVKPKAILVLGNVALAWALGRKGKITQAEGSTFNYETSNGVIPCVPSRHPSSIVRMENTENYKYLLQKLKENLLLFKRVLYPTEDTFKFLNEVPTLEGAKWVYTDIETDGLNPYREESVIHCMALEPDNEDNTYCFPLNKEHWKSYQHLFKTYPIIAQRGTFEGTWIKRHFGVTPRLYFDTKLASYLRDENDQSGLKFQAIKYLNVEPWSEEQDFKNPDLKKMLPYNARDTRYGKRLYKERDLPYFALYPKLSRLMKSVLLPAEEIFIDVIDRGFHINTEDATQKLELCHENKAKLNEQINDIAGCQVNPGSPKQMVKLLYDDLGLKCPVKTKSGAKSSSEAALIRLAGEHELVDVLLEWRKWQKYASTYLTPWLAKGPILHAGYDFTGTDTGRLSSSMVKNKRGEKKLGGTLHQCPRDPFIRNLITARSPDFCIVAADLSQIELRLVAHVANEYTMIDIFNSWEDIHLATAKSLTTKEIDKETRKKAKAVNFGFIYGMWAKKFKLYAKEKFALELSIKESEDYRETFFDKYSGVLPWHNRVEALVSRTGFIDSIFGRRRHLPAAMFEAGYDEWIRREAVRQAINSPIQGAGSDLDLMIAVLIYSPHVPWKFKADPDKAFLVGAAHDSLINEVHRDYVKEFKEGINWTVANLPVKKWFDFEFKVPILMDVVAYQSCWEGEILET